MNIRQRMPALCCRRDVYKRQEESCDFTVVYVHWGIEKNTQPEEYQKTLARQYIDAGADRGV